MNREPHDIESIKSAEPGDKVRYRFAHRMLGVLVRKSHAHGGGWFVKWENGQTLPAAYENLDLVKEDNSIKDAYNLGLQHGQDGKYEPPSLWVLQKFDLYLVAYQNGYNKGQRGRLAVRGQA